MLFLMALLVSQAAPATPDVAPKEPVKPASVYTAETAPVVTPPPPREDPITSGKQRPIQDSFIDTTTGKFWLPSDLDKLELSAKDLLLMVPILKYTVNDASIRMKFILPEELLPHFFKLLRDDVFVMIDEPLRTEPNDRWYDSGFYILTVMTNVMYHPREKALVADEAKKIIPWVDWVKKRANTHVVLPLKRGWDVFPKGNRVPELTERVKATLANIIFTKEKVDLQGYKTERFYVVNEKVRTYTAYYAMSCEEAAVNTEWNSTHTNPSQQREGYKSEAHFKQCVEAWQDYMDLAQAERRLDKQIEETQFEIEKLKGSLKDLEAEEKKPESPPPQAPK